MAPAASERRDGFFARLLQHPPRARATALAVVGCAIGLIGVADHYTGLRLVMILFYIIPVVIGAAWLGGCGCYIVPFLCSATHALADWIGHNDPPTPVTLLNRLFVLMIYLIVARCISELMGLKRHLEERVQARTRELEDALAAQKELQNRIGAASRYERNAIGRELHDGLCQHLAATNIAAGMLAHKLDAAPAPAEAAEARNISGMLTGAIDQTRHIARGLLLASIKPAEFDAELHELCRGAARKYKIACAYTHDGPAPQLDDAQASHLFFIAQEALRNALRHSGATRVDIALREEAGTLALSIADNGRGFEPGVFAEENALRNPDAAPESEGRRAGLGLRIMRHRAELIGGRLEIESAATDSHARAGTRILCLLRLPAASAAGNFGKTSSASATP